MAIMDETDSGLDIDALRTVAEGINALRTAPKMGILLITHYQRMLNYIKPDMVHVLYRGPHRPLRRQRAGGRAGSQRATTGSPTRSTRPVKRKRV